MTVKGTITGVKTLGERLKHAREMRGLSQEQLATAAKCSQSAVGNVEAGARQSLRNLILVARALSVSADWLFDGRGPAPVPVEPAGSVHELRAAYGAPWPLGDIPPDEFFSLSLDARAEVVGFAKGLLRSFRSSTGTHG